MSYHTTQDGQQIFEGAITRYMQEHRVDRQEAINMILDDRALDDEVIWNLGSK